MFVKEWLMPKWDKNSTAYSIVYALLLSVVFGGVLAVVASTLKPLQERNIRLEKMSYILRAARLQLSDPHSIEVAYRQYVTEYVFNGMGEELKGVKAFDIVLKKELTKPPQQQRLPVYLFHKQGEEPLVIIPVEGMGLWGPIWGYVALRSDLNTIYGAVFDHKSETPGLGAEINQQWFQERFVGKVFARGGSYCLRVVKPPVFQQDECTVDGLSGATATTLGVDEMLRRCRGIYDKVLKSVAHLLSQSKGSVTLVAGAKNTNGR